MKNLTGVIWFGAGSIMLMTGIISLDYQSGWISALQFLAAGLDFLNAYIHLSKTNESN